jgi:catechol 2,3-dioxygenase-like lactoylglutathione lyase family enzyme
MIKRIEQVFLFVSDLNKSVSFYNELLGLPIVASENDWVTFEIDDQTLTLQKCAGEFTAHLNSPRNVQFALEVDDLDSFYVNLEGKGVPFFMEPTDQSWGGRLAQLLDPDGNILQLIE